MVPYQLPDDFPVAVYLDWRMAQRRQYLPMPHVHNVLEIGYCHHGAGILSIAKKILPFRAGDVVIIGPAEPHLASNRAGVVSTWSWVFLDPLRLLAPLAAATNLPDIRRFQGTAFHNVFRAAHHAQIHSLVLAIFDELRNRRANYPWAVRGLTVALLAQLHRLEGLTDDPPMELSATDHIRRLAPALQMIQGHADTKVTIAGLARACSMSPTYFTQTFRRSLGRSPYQYLQQCRLSMACVELEETDLTVEAVAEKHGFPTLSCFVRAFKKFTGVPPRRWARQAHRSA